MTQGSAASNVGPFDRRVVVAIVVAGVLAFAAFVWLSAYAPKVKSFGSEGFAPMSKNAVGFAGTFKLIEAVTHEKVGVLEDDEAYNEPGLVIMPLATDSNPEAIRIFAETRASNVPGGSTLFVLPKWQTRPLPNFSNDWVQSVGQLDYSVRSALVRALAKSTLQYDEAKGGTLTGLDGARRPLPSEPITVALADAPLAPVLQAGSKQAFLVRLTDIEGGSAYLLTDPDLLANHALRTPAGARTAMAIVDAVRPEGEAQISVDPEPVRGEAPKRNRNLLQLMFEPPFLAITLAILAAALLAALHAFGRFGPALPEPRAIPFGKRALADNTAALFARTGAVARLGERYVAMTRDAAAQALGATHLPVPALEAWLARLPRVRGPDFAVLAANLRAARGIEAVRAGAAALHDWKNEVMRDR